MKFRTSCRYILCAEFRFVGIQYTRLLKNHLMQKFHYLKIEIFHFLFLLQKRAVYIAQSTSRFCVTSSTFLITERAILQGPVKHVFLVVYRTVKHAILVVYRTVKHAILVVYSIVKHVILQDCWSLTERERYTNLIMRGINKSNKQQWT